MADTTENTEAPTPQSTEAFIAEADLGQLNALLAAEPAQAKAEPDVQPAESTAAESTQVEPEQSAAETDADDSTDADSADEPAQKHKQFRIRPTDEKEAAVLQLMKAGKTMAEAFAAVHGAKQEPAKTEPEKQDAAPEPTAAIDASISKSKATLANLEKQLASAEESVDLPSVNRLTREIAKLDRAIERDEARREEVLAAAQREQAQSRESAEVSADRDRAVSLFPELGDKNSAEFKAFAAFVDKNQNNPEYADTFASGKWRTVLAKDFALEHGMTPAHRRTASPSATQTSAQATKTAPVKQAHRPQASAAKVISSKAAPTGSANAPTLTAHDLDKMSHKELSALLR